MTPGAYWVRVTGKYPALIEAFKDRVVKMYKRDLPWYDPLMDLKDFPTRLGRDCYGMILVAQGQGFVGHWLARVAYQVMYSVQVEVEGNQPGALETGLERIEDWGRGLGAITHHCITYRNPEAFTRLIKSERIGYVIERKL